MRLLSQQPLWLLLVGVAPALAAFEDFSFPGNAGNNSAPRKCGNMPYGCDPPNMCSKDTKTGKWYCCAPGVSDAVCWNGATKCEGTGTNVPTDQQLGCTGGTTKYCCLKEAEKCTQLQGQFNICWSTADNALAALNATKLNETFSSLSSANPSATSYTVPRAQLLGYTSTTAGASSSAPASATASTSTTSSPSPPPSKDDGGLSGGAIGGIVGGVIGGLALLGALGFFLWRRRRNAGGAGKLDPHAPAGDPYQGYGYQPGYPPQDGYNHSPQPPVAQLHSPLPPTDKYAHHQEPVEVPAYNNNPVEMDASYYQQHGHHPQK